MNPSQAEFWQAGVRRGKGKPCPKLVWVYIKVANKRPARWEDDSGYGARMLLRVIARSPTIFRLKNPELKEALERLGLEWLTPSQIGRIRECPAPRRKTPRHPSDRLFGYWGVKPNSPVRSQKCGKLFWAWRQDQTTCDPHWRHASMLRVEKSRKLKQERERNARQLADAREQLKRVRRANKKAQKLARDSQPPAITPSKLKAQNDRANFLLLQSVWLDTIETPADTDDPDRLDVMIKGGYVLPPAAESDTYHLSGQGLLLLGQLRKRTGLKEVIG